MSQEENKPMTDTSETMPTEAPEAPETPSAAPAAPPRKKASVVPYLAVLFAAAFLLLLLAYFMQQRTSEQAIGSLRESITSIESLNELLEENRTLREENETLEGQLAQAQADAQAQAENQTSVQTMVEVAQSMERQLSAVLTLERLEFLCDAGQYDDARILDGWDESELTQMLAQADELQGQLLPEQKSLTERFREVQEELAEH